MNDRIKIVAESDDFDGTVVDGLAYGALGYDGVSQHLVDEPEVGWHESRYTPYLVFHHGPPLSDAEVKAVVERAVSEDSFDCEPPRISTPVAPPPAPYTQTQLRDTCTFADMAKLGLQWGKFYRRCECRYGPDGSVTLLLHNDASHLPPEDSGDLS